MNKPLVVREEFRWSIRKKGKHVFNVCAQFAVLHALAFVLMASASTMAYANPTGGTVVGGSATFSSSGKEFDIHQTSDRAIINWGSFDIANGETTKFIQPGASSLALNRVTTSGQISTINGNLLANGHVIIINPNGVLIGPNGNVDVAGFVASSANIGDSAFMNGTGVLQFNQAGNANAVLQNQGHVTIENAGLALLVAPTVKNSGVIEGNLARLQMGAGDTFGVDLYGDGLLNLAVGPGKRSLNAGNTGRIIASGGKVLMTAAAASNVVDSVINTSGVVQATSLVSKGGEIILTGAGAHVKVAGKVDASGKTGGGNIKIGGDLHGGGNVAHAATVDIAKDATVSANASASGDGGTIAVWSTIATAAQGLFEAKGGATGGNGGLVETSSEGDLAVDGASVNTLAPAGSAGNWLLDPINFTVDGANAAAIGHSLSNVTLSALNNISFLADLNMGYAGVGLTAKAGTPAGGGYATGTINLNGHYIRTFGGNVILQSGRSIDVSNAKIYTRGGAVIMASGDIAIGNSSIGTGGGNVNISAYRQTSTTCSFLFGCRTRVLTNGNVFITNSLIGTSSGSGSGGIFLSGNLGGFNNCFYNCSVSDPVRATSLALTALGQTKTYGDLFIFDGTEFIASGLVSGDVLTGATLSSTGSATMAPVGNYTIGVSNAVLASSFGNYHIAYHTGVMHVDPATLTVTANSTGKTYGDTVTFTGAEFTTAGLRNSDTVTSEALTSAGTAGTAGAGDYAITGSNAIGTGLSNYNINYVDGNLHIRPATLTITSTDARKTYGDAVIFNGTEFTTLGLKNHDTVTSETISSDGAPATANAGDYAVAGSHAVGTGLSNYTIRYVNGNLHVSPYTLDIAAYGESKVYGSADPYLGYRFIDGTSLRNGDAVTGGLTRAAGETVLGGPYAINQGTLTAGSNYSIHYIGNTLTITPKGLTISATGISKVYDGNRTDAVKLSVDGIVAGDDVSASNVSANFDDKNVGTSKNVSVDGISLSGVDAGNYSFNASATTTADITPLEISVSAIGVNKVYDGNTSDAAVLNPLSGIVKGDDVSASYDSANFSDKNVGTAKDVAVNGIVLSGADASNYTVNENTTTSADITPKGLTVSAIGANKVYDGNTTDVVMLSVDGIVEGDDVAASNDSANFGDKNVGTSKNVSVDGITLSGADAGNYSFNTTTATTADITPYTLNISADAKTKVYGSADPTLTYHLTGDTSLQGDDSSESVFTGHLTREAGETVSSDPYDINQGTLDAGPNYNISFEGSSFRINPKALYIRANNESKTYGDTVTFNGTEFTTSGLVKDVTVNGVTLNDTVTSVYLYSQGANAHANAGSYRIYASEAEGSGLSNYEIIYNRNADGRHYYNPGVLTVNRKALTITANDQTKIYNTAFVFDGTEYHSDGLVNGDVIGPITITSDGAPAPAQPGAYDIVPSAPRGGEQFLTLSICEGECFKPEGGVLSNYDVTYVNGKMTIPVPFNPTLHFDPLGRPILSVADQDIDADPSFESFATTVDTDISLGGADTGAGPDGGLAGLEPAAGGDDNKGKKKHKHDTSSAEDLSNVEPAAGGNAPGGAPAGGGDVSCANDFLNGKSCP